MVSLSEGIDGMIAKVVLTETAQPLPKDIRDRFASAARTSYKGFRTFDSDRWEKRGLTELKRRTLGLCGTSSIKPISDLADIFIKMGVSDSVGEGIQLARNLYDTSCDYGGGMLFFRRRMLLPEEENVYLHRRDYADFLFLEP